MLSISVDGVEILGRPRDGVSRVEGLFVGPDGFNGWDDGVDVRREAVERPGEHGEYDLPVFNGSRVISIDGHVFAWSDDDLRFLRDRVMGVAADGGRHQLSVTHQGSTLHATVRRGAKPLFVDSGKRSGRRRATFALYLVAADPRKYGEVHEYQSGEPAVHYGNFAASPELIVTGTMPGYSVHGPDGRTLTVSQELAAGQTHRIDLLTGRVYRDGVLQVGVRRGPVWTVPASSAAVHTLVPASGSGSLTVRVTDTFI